jgi:hypothetical protein
MEKFWKKATTTNFSSKKDFTQSFTTTSLSLNDTVPTSPSGWFLLLGYE